MVFKLSNWLLERGKLKDNSLFINKEVAGHTSFIYGGK